MQVRSAALDTWLPEQVSFIQCKLATDFSELFYSLFSELDSISKPGQL